MQYLKYDDSIRVTKSIFAPTFSASVKPHLTDCLAVTITAGAGALGLSETHLRTQLYDAKWPDTWVDDDYTEENLKTANGEVFLTHNPDKR